MLYLFLKVLVRITLKLFFKKIYITGLEHLKHDRPQLISSNHPNGFLEPLIMACFFPKSLHFLVRGDVFENRILKPLLQATHQIPIFRFRDGFSKLRENSQTMDASLQVLLEKKNLLIFVEGGTESIKRLRPLQKGIVRLAYQVVESNDELDVEVLSIGINFTYGDRFNREVMLSIGPPIEVKKYYAHFLQDKISGYEVLLQDIATSMKERIIHLDDAAGASIFERLVVIQRGFISSNLFPVFMADETPLRREIKLADAINTLNQQKKSEIQDDLKKIKSLLASQGLDFSCFNKKPINVRKALLLALGLIPAVLGFVLHSLPILGAVWFTKTKVKQKEFKASILMISVLVLTLIWYISIFAVVVFTGASLLIIPIVMILGLWSRWYYTYWEDTLFITTKTWTQLREKCLSLVRNKDLIQV